MSGVSSSSAAEHPSLEKLRVLNVARLNFQRPPVRCQTFYVPYSVSQF